jgi:putative spermidine/putrescine transport system permease protein
LAADVVWHRLSGIVADPAVARFYTFDDFTMSVTPDLTLANLQALFNPANYDIIVRTLVMALAVTIASAMLAFPMAWYMARYTSGKMKAFLHCRDAANVGQLYRQSLCVDAAAGERWRGAVVSHLGLEPLLLSFLTLPGGRRQYVVDLRLGAFWCSSTSGCRL